jgi:hypothetical protein
MSYLQTVPRREPPKPSFELLKPHLEAGHELILLKPLSDEPLKQKPLCDPFELCSCCCYSPLTVEQVRAHMAKGGNVGVSIVGGMLVIDVDTRGAPEGVSPIRQLEDSLGVNLSRGPLVLNGGCGQHFYFKYPTGTLLEIKDSSPEFPRVKPRTRWAYHALVRGWDGSLRLQDSLKEFPALKFRTGGMVLASGSVHPITQEHCFCEILQDNLADVPLIPRELLVRIVQKPRYSGDYYLS